MMIATDRQIKLSTMTGKLTGFKAINTNTVTNDFCQKMNQDRLYLRIVLQHGNAARVAKELSTRLAK
jgi:hypothetical protein